MKQVSQILYRCADVRDNSYCKRNIDGRRTALRSDQSSTSLYEFDTLDHSVT